MAHLPRGRTEEIESLVDVGSGLDDPVGVQDDGVPSPQPDTAGAEAAGAWEADRPSLGLDVLQVTVRGDEERRGVTSSGELELRRRRRLGFRAPASPDPDPRVYSKP